MIHVVSTGLNAPTKDVCLASVKAQRGVDVQHFYIEASEQDPRKGVIENLIDVIGRLPPTAVVAWLDGDDWLAHKDVLAGVEKLHATGAWVTYGSFMTLEGNVVICDPYKESPRYEPWHATHLRTFLAGLFQKIKHVDLQFNLQWISLALDQAAMIPIVEMAGLDRTRAVSEVRCIYNTQNMWEARASQQDLAREQKAVELIRAKKPYARLDRLVDA